MGLLLYGRVNILFKLEFMSLLSFLFLLFLTVLQTYSHKNCKNSQWAETNQSNFCIYSMDIRLLLPHGTMLTAIQM
jgi:hypothetical protein